MPDTPQRPADPPDSNTERSAHASFAADPAAWFDHVDHLLGTDAASVIDLPPENWVDPAGHAWRVLTTADGPEVRPGLQNPFLRQGGLPRITALLVTPVRLQVELSMREWREVGTLSIGEVSVRDLGLAMLTGIELPHEGLDRVSAEVWAAGERRWARIRDAGRVAFALDGERSRV